MTLEPETMSKTPTLLAEAMSRRGLTQTSLGALLNVSRQQMWKLYHNHKAMDLVWARRLAPFLDVSATELLGVGSIDTTPAPAKDLPPVSDRVARFRAARWACWEDDMGKARQRLKLGEDDLERIERGDLDLEDDLLVRFAGVTGIPLSYFMTGSLEGVPGPLSARIALFDPDLVLGLLSLGSNQTGNQQA